MNNNEAVKKQESKTAILEKLMESIMIGEVDCKDIAKFVKYEKSERCSRTNQQNRACY